jgi:hypothetical protein
MFLEWRRKPQQIIGTIEQWDRKPDGDVDLTLFHFDGALDGENFRITLNSVMNNEMDYRLCCTKLSEELRMK